MKAIVNQLLTRYDLEGKGALVLLLHGWGDNAAGLANIQAALARQYQVLAVDLPGFGGTEAPKTVWDLDDYCAFVAALLDKLALAQPYAIIGHSNGGAIAIRGISLGQLRPQKLILLAAAGIRNSNQPKRLALKVLAKTGNVATLWLPERHRQALRKSLYGVSGSDMLVVPELQETFKKTVRQDVKADAATITIPTLLLYAENDRAIPLSDGREYQHLIPNSQLKVVRQAGHFVHLDQPEQVIRSIEEFLA